jgi:hypothetical protein
MLAVQVITTSLATQTLALVVVARGLLVVTLQTHKAALAARVLRPPFPAHL